MAIIAEIKSASLDSNNNVSAEVEFKKDSTVLETRLLKYTFSNFFNVADLKAQALADINGIMEAHMLRLYGESKNTDNLADLVDQAVGVTRSIDNMVITFNGTDYEIDEDGNITPV